MTDTVWTAAIFGDLDILKKLVEEDEIECDEIDDRGFTPLTWSARNGHMNVLEYLCDERKCSTEKGSFGGLKPLHHACNKNLESIVKYLISAGSDANSTDDNMDTPLHWAASRGILNIVMALLDAGADFNAANAQGVTPIHKACTFGQFPIVRALIKKGADYNAPDSNGDTPLHYASKCGFENILKVLLDNKALPAANTAGQTPIDVAFDDKIKSVLAPAE